MLAALATEDDLAARNITVPDGMDPATALNGASAAIRDAAGCSISYGPSTITLVVDDPCQFDLPAGPVESVASVLVDSVAVTGWRKVGDTIYMPTVRWWGTYLPVEVTVTYTHGYVVIPGDIIDLCCSIAAMSFTAGGEGDGYADSSRVGKIALGDFAETFIHPAGTESPSPVALPDSLKQSLRARFGGSVALVKMAR